MVFVGPSVIPRVTERAGGYALDAESVEGKHMRRDEALVRSAKKMWWWQDMAPHIYNLHIKHLQIFEGAWRKSGELTDIILAECHEFQGSKPPVV
jgi:hypothetical protein